MSDLGLAQLILGPTGLRPPWQKDGTCDFKVTACHISLGIHTLSLPFANPKDFTNINRDVRLVDRPSHQPYQVVARAEKNTPLLSTSTENLAALPSDAEATNGSR